MDVALKISAPTSDLPFYGIPRLIVKLFGLDSPDRSEPYQPAPWNQRRANLPFSSFSFILIILPFNKSVAVQGSQKL
jgi:hypothetical protein